MSNKILLIDDSLTQLETLKLQLFKAGFEVETAKDGSEGYKKVFDTLPDLVLSDIMMPQINGYQLCRLLKNDELTNKIPIVLLTVLDKKLDRFWGNKSGADKFISKTANFSEIEDYIKNLITKNPISEEYKQNIINSKTSTEAIQNQINLVLDELLMNSTFINEFRDLSEYLLRERLLVEKFFELLNSFIDYNVAGIFLNNPDKNEKNILYLDIYKNPVSGFIIEKIKRDFFSQMPNMSAFNIRDFNHEIINESTETGNIILNFDELKTKHIIPLISDDKLLGGICFFNKEECNYSDFKFYKTMIDELTILFKMQYLYCETEYLSVIDGLTGLYNRRHFEVNLEREYLRVKRYPAELSLAMIDIDHFKKVNDTYGHQFGDYVLKEISNIISASFRKTDMIYRYGGEELTIILPGTPLEGAQIPLERLRDKIANYNFNYNDIQTNITISIGISCFTTEIKSQETLVEYADKALYKAKQSGRNKLVTFSDEKINNLL